MSIVGLLYELQQTELEIETDERLLSEKSRLGESRELTRARNELALEQKRLDEMKRQERSIDADVDDISAKLKAAEEKLYGGRIGNPKELASLQHEVEGMKTTRGRLEEKALDIMGEIEALIKKVDILKGEFKKAEAEEQQKQQQLSGEIEALKLKLAELKDQQQELTSSLDTKTIEFYRRLRKQKGMAVARVEKGRCLGCRILLATTELQRARNGIVQCSSCGRILFVS